MTMTPRTARRLSTIAGALAIGVLHAPAAQAACVDLRERSMDNGRINAWDFRRAVPGDRVVIATLDGFWAAEVR